MNLRSFKRGITRGYYVRGHAVVFHFYVRKMGTANVILAGWDDYLKSGCYFLNKRCTKLERGRKGEGERQPRKCETVVKLIIHDYSELLGECLKEH